MQTGQVPEHRYLRAPITGDAVADGKMAFVSGPRQVGKTTLGRSLLTHPGNYFTWDDPVFRRAWARSPRDAVAQRGAGPIVLDELHKDRRWKTRLKGYFDVVGPGDGVVVTGSARLDLYRRGGDSLLGRFLPYRLHPFSVGESATPTGPEDLLRGRAPRFPVADLLRLGGFPEPLLAGREAKARRWSKLRRERLLAEDVRDLRAVEDLGGLRVLTDLLPERVGSLLSINALREDVGVAFGTAKAWIDALEALYHCFLVRPYARRLARAVRTAPKLYLYDLLDLPATGGARLENLTALHLRKACDYWTDLALGEFELHFVRDKEQREVDFLVVRDRKPWLLVECRSTDTDPAPALVHYARLLSPAHAVQLVTTPKHDRAYPALGVRVLGYDRFLADLP